MFLASPIAVAVMGVLGQGQRRVLLFLHPRGARLRPFLETPIPGPHFRQGLPCTRVRRRRSRPWWTATIPRRLGRPAASIPSASSFRHASWCPPPHLLLGFAAVPASPVSRGTRRVVLPCRPCPNVSVSVSPKGDGHGHSHTLACPRHVRTRSDTDTLGKNGSSLPLVVTGR